MVALCCIHPEFEIPIVRRAVQTGQNLAIGGMSLRCVHVALLRCVCPWSEQVK